MSEAYYVTHELKILPEYFKAVRDYTKNFEIRKCDREYHVGDVLLLREWDGNKYTGEKVKREIEYIYKGDGSYGLAEGYCILGITLPLINTDDVEGENE